MGNTISEGAAAPAFNGWRYRVLWLRNGKERKSPWFGAEGTADRLYRFLIDKGYKAVVYVD